MCSESSIYSWFEINLTFAIFEGLPHTSIQSSCQCTSAARVLQSAFVRHHCNVPKISFTVPLVWNTERVIKVSKLWCIKVLTLLVILAWIQHRFWKIGILWYDFTKGRKQRARFQKPFKSYYELKNLLQRWFMISSDRSSNILRQNFHRVEGKKLLSSWL